MGRRSLAVAMLATLVLAANAPAAKPRPSWAQAEIKLVVARGLMAPDIASFRPDDVLTRGELADLTARLTGRVAVPVAQPLEPVTMAALDAQLVRALGLQDAAAAFTRSARAAAVATPARFGNEVVARLLALRKNHPDGQDALERLPDEPATRAEAAYSVAQMLRFRGWEVQNVRAAAATFVLPALSPWQKRILSTAFRFVGYPYVWGGESEARVGPYGPQPQGGFDCSGFLWRVFKVEPYPGAPALANALKGRTSMEMSAEVPKAARIPLARLAPGDVVFFGDAGPKSKPAQVGHVGLYVGSGWLVHSSRYGTTLTPLSGWYAQRFAWARRPLAEAALEPALQR